MVFSVWDYVVPGALVPLGAIIILLVLAVIIGRIAAKQGHARWVCVFPLCIWLVATLWGISFCAKGMEYPITAWIQADYPMHTTTGQIASISDAPAPPLYGSSLQPAKLLEVDGKTFYVLRTNVNAGEWVTIQWSTDARIIYALDKNTSVNTTTNTQITGQPNDELPLIATLGSWINCICISLFLALLILQYSLGKRIGRFLVEKDRTFTDGVFPNKYGLLYYGVIIFLLCGILLGMYLTGFYGAAVLLVIAISIMTYVLICKQTITVRLEEKLVYKELRSEQRICLDHIASVEWGRSGIPFNRQLVIHLHSGQAIVLQQEHYWGLESLFSKLQQKLNDISMHTGTREGDEGPHSTVDGSVY